MNDFLNTLIKSLRHMSAKEKADIVQDYTEHFDAGLAAGKSEELIAEELGDPTQLAKMFTAANALEIAHKSKGIKNTYNMLGAIISYKIGGGSLMGLLYCSFVMFMAITFAASIGLVIIGLTCLGLVALEIINGFIGFSFLAFFTAIVMCSGGILFFISNQKFWRFVTEKLTQLGRRITQINLNVLDSKE